MTYKPPAGLSKEAKRLWKQLAIELNLDGGGHLVLNLLAQSWDRREEARRALKQDGLIVADRFQQRKQHPAVAVERDCSLQILRCYHALGMDLQPQEVE